MDERKEMEELEGVHERQEGKYIYRLEDLSGFPCQHYRIIYLIFIKIKNISIYLKLSHRLVLLLLTTL